MSAPIAILVYFRDGQGTQAPERQVHQHTPVMKVILSVSDDRQNVSRIRGQKKLLLTKLHNRQGDSEEDLGTLEKQAIPNSSDSFRWESLAEEA